MKKSKELFELVILVFLFVVLINLTLLDPGSRFGKFPSRTPRIKKEAEKKVELFFSSPEVKDNFFSTSLVLNSPEKVTAVDLVIVFDPEALILVEATPGPNLTPGTVLKKEIDQEKGRLRLALFSQAASGTLGSLVDFEFLLTQTSQPVKIALLTEQSSISAIGGGGNLVGTVKPLIYQNI